MGQAQANAGLKQCFELSGSESTKPGQSMHSLLQSQGSRLFSCSKTDP